MCLERSSAVCSALLLLFSACATSAPSPLAQGPIPVSPLVVPRPITVPAPVGLSPPVPLSVAPEELPAAPRPKSSSDKEPAPTLTSEQRPECLPQRVPHRGGDALHNECADKVPLNDARGFDVLVNGKSFDALQLGRRVLWEIKTDNFDTYAPALQKIVLDKQVPDLGRERDLALACGFDFRVGVRSAAHQAALRARERTLNIIIMDWC